MIKKDSKRWLVGMATCNNNISLIEDMREDPCFVPGMASSEKPMKFSDHKRTRTWIYAQLCSVIILNTKRYDIINQCDVVSFFSFSATFWKWTPGVTPMAGEEYLY